MFKYYKFILLYFLLVPVIAINFLVTGEQQFVFLAKAFLNHSLSLTTLPPTIADLSLYNEKYFWPLGPFPAILLIPFVYIFDLNFTQGFIQVVLNVMNFFLIKKILEKLNIDHAKSFWISIFYIFGSVYTPVATIPFSWYFAQIVATSLILMAIYIYLSNKNWFFIGLMIALATLTRISLLLSLVFFVPSLIKNPPKFSKLAMFLAPVLVSICVIGIYNHLRFNSPFESGYKYQLIPEDAQKRRDEGLMSVKHIPANLYYMLLKTPDPILKEDYHVFKAPYLRFDDFGMSIFFMSPLLFIIFKAGTKDTYVKIAIITITILSLPIITYYGIGYKQVGFRYALDFFPFLLFLLASASKTIGISTIRTLTIIGIIITWFFTIEKLSGF